MTAFDLTAPLLPGRLAIEASAGTGKTYTLAALATRHVAEHQVAASELLIVTFTRAATAELRGRIRDRMAEAAEALRGDAPVLGDPLLVHLAATDRSQRQADLARAVTEFDAATIATIHGFATQALGTLGAASSGDRDAALTEDARDLQGEVCADVLAVAATRGHPAEDLPTLRALISSVEVAMRTPDLGLAPGASEPGATAADHLLRDLVARAMSAIAAQRRRSGMRSFDDLLIDLRRELRGRHGDAVRAALRQRYRVALIDEFQDTDPVQWAIFSELFGADGASSLVLVGDPKQAIYSFRGADIGTYVAATASGAERRTLATNHRSDGAMITALDALLSGAIFGDEAIGFVPVQVAPGHEDRRLLGPGGVALPALSLRLALDQDLGRIKTGKPPPIAASDADKAVQADLVEQIRDLLDGATIPVGNDSDPDGDRDHDPGGDQRPDGDDRLRADGRRGVRPSDIAVLTRSVNEGELVHAQLLAAGVPAVLARGGSVLESAAADQWRTLLAAMARPSDPRRARAFALSWFSGHDAGWVAEVSDDDLGEVQNKILRWAETLVAHGVEALLRRIWAESGVSERVLARNDGDRAMTDLDHIAELLRTLPAGRQPGVAGLAAILDREPDPQAKADAEREGDVASRRIASESEAVQILTIWVSKGLEFPIVCVPGLFREPRSRPVIADDEQTGERVLDLTDGKRWPDKAEAKARKARSVAEAVGEDLRLLYVALTRAQHHTIVWWSRIQSAEKSALARVLFARNEGSIDPEAFVRPKVALPADAEAADVLAPLVHAGSGTIAVSVHGHPPRRATPWQDPQGRVAGDELVTARLGRDLARTTNRWSFTKVTAAAHDLDDADAPDVGGGDTGPGPADRGGNDEGVTTLDATEEDPLVFPSPSPGGSPTVVPGLQPGIGRAGSSPLAALPAGARFGTLVHAVLEHLDFAADPLAPAISEHLGRELAWQPMDLTPVGVEEATSADGRALLVDGLVAVLETPLGSAFCDRRLRDLGPGDRLDELAFELRLADGGPPATDRAIGRLLLDHLDADDRYRPWAERLAHGAFDVALAGHLTGSIDLVARVGGEDGEPRYVIADYKTNRLHEHASPVEAHHYGAPALVEAMGEHHYPLQALLYSVALHRYLRWRQRGYRPEVHLGGAAYLFLRGMSGPDAPVVDGAVNGVATWAIPPALVVALSDLLDGSAS